MIRVIRIWFRDRGVSLGLALLVHALAGVLLIWGTSLSVVSPRAAPGTARERQPIEATVVSEKDYLNAEAQIRRVNQARAERLTQLQRRARAAQAARKKAQTELARLQQQRQVALRQAQAQQLQLKTRQQQLASVEAEAKKVRAQRRQARQQLLELRAAAVAAAKARQAEQARLAKLQAEARARTRAIAAAKRAALVQAAAARKAQLMRQLRAEQVDRNRRALGNWVRAIELQVQRNWIRPPDVATGINCRVRVTQLPSGQVVKVEMLSCNGGSVVVQSIITAVNRASPLPQPSDPTIFQRRITFVFQPGPNQ